MRGRIRAPQAEVGGAQVTVWFPSWAPLALGPRGGGGPTRDRVRVEGELALCLPDPPRGPVGGETGPSESRAWIPGALLKSGAHSRNITCV